MAKLDDVEKEMDVTEAIDTIIQSVESQKAIDSSGAQLAAYRSKVTEMLGNWSKCKQEVAPSEHFRRNMFFLADYNLLEMSVSYDSITSSLEAMKGRNEKYI